MTNPLLTTSEVLAGELLAAVDNAEYRAVVAVYKVNGSGAATFYCSGGEWQQTPPAIHARYQAEIAQLREQLACAHAALTAKDEPIAEEAPTPALTCPRCGKSDFKRLNGLKAHIRLAHKQR